MGFEPTTSAVQMPSRTSATVRDRSENRIKKRYPVGRRFRHSRTFAPVTVASQSTSPWFATTDHWRVVSSIRRIATSLPARIFEAVLLAEALYAFRVDLQPVTGMKRRGPLAGRRLRALGRVLEQVLEAAG